MWPESRPTRRGRDRAGPAWPRLGVRRPPSRSSWPVIGCAGPAEERAGRAGRSGLYKARRHLPSPARPLGTRTGCVPPGTRCRTRTSLLVTAAPRSVLIPLAGPRRAPQARPAPVPGERPRTRAVLGAGIAEWGRGGGLRRRTPRCVRHLCTPLAFPRPLRSRRAPQPSAA